MTGGNEKSSIIRMFHVHHNYGAKRALIDVTLDIAKNEFIFISGPSGAGKTTLLKLFYLSESVSEGQILIDGLNLSRIPHRRVAFLRRKFGIIFQDYKLIPHRTVYDNVALVLEAAGKHRRLIQKKVKSVLRLVGLEDRYNAFPPSLSGGEQQRAAVARAIVGDPKIVLADEPTGSLDADAAKDIIDLLRGVYIKGATVIIATHDKDMIRKTGGRVLFLKKGRLEGSAFVEKQHVLEPRHRYYRIPVHSHCQCLSPFFYQYQRTHEHMEKGCPGDGLSQTGP
ncbi:MAG: cell division ATP-binding protein FtsE [Planctomycetota bacterium]|jgi:cell division transport system ATP-binding protein